MQVIIGQRGHAAAAGCPRQEAKLHQIRLVHILQRYRLFPDGGSQRFQSHRTAAVVANNGSQHPPVDIIQAQIVHLQATERQVGRLFGLVVLWLRHSLVRP